MAPISGAGSRLDGYGGRHSRVVYRDTRSASKMDYSLWFFSCASEEHNSSFDLRFLFLLFGLFFSLKRDLDLCPYFLHLEKKTPSISHFSVPIRSLNEAEDIIHNFNLFDTMIFTSSIALLLALAPATLFAAPTPTTPDVADIVKRGLSAGVIQALTDGNCDLSGVSMPPGKEMPFTIQINSD
jgi:hypothetical protein